MEPPREGRFGSLLMALSNISFIEYDVCFRAVEMPPVCDEIALDENPVVIVVVNTLKK